MKRYVLVGGEIVSPDDGDIHYIAPEKLVELYNLDPGECIIFDNVHKLDDCEELEELTFLYPDSDGDYDIEKLMKEAESFEI